MASRIWSAAVRLGGVFAVGWAVGHGTAIWLHWLLLGVIVTAALVEASMKAVA